MTRFRCCLATAALAACLFFSLGHAEEFREYPLTTSHSMPLQVAVASDSRIYFTESGINKIGRYDPSRNDFAEFRIPTADSGPNGIDVGDDGVVTFAETRARKIGRFDPARESFHEY